MDPRCSMYGMFTYIYPKSGPNVGESFHSWSMWGYDISNIIQLVHGRTALWSAVLGAPDKPTLMVEGLICPKLIGD